MLSPKQLTEMTDLVERSLDNPHPIDTHTAVKPYGDMGHVLLRSELAGADSEVVISRESLSLLGQLLVAMSQRNEKREKEEAPK